MRTTEPTTIVKGERIEWTKSYCDFSAEEYTLEYRYRGPGGGINVTATADGSDFNAVVAADVSDNFTATGKHRWQAWLTEIADTDNTFVVGEGTVEVKEGFTSASLAAVELRTPEKIALDAINAALANAATSDQLEYEISTPAGSRRIKRMSRTELIELQKHYSAIVSRQNLQEKLKNGGKFGTPVKATMSSQ
jgi:hypothetical protein